MAKGKKANKVGEVAAQRRELLLAPAADAGIVKGYASLFGGTLRDNSHGELFAPGCFAKSIADLHDAPLAAGEPSRIAVSMRHDWTDGFAVPLVLREDERGLWTETQARLIAPGEPNHEDWLQIKDGVLSGISIEFDSNRSKFELLSEAEARALGFEGEWNQWSIPRRWTEVYLYGFSYVLHPSMGGARVLETRETKGREVGMDEEKMAAMIGAAVAEACKPYEERMGKIEARLGALEAEEAMPEDEPADPEEPMVEESAEAARTAEVEGLRAEVLCLRHAGLAPAQARALLRLAPEERDALLALLPQSSRTAPAIPPLGRGANAREGGAPTLEQIAAQARAEAKGDNVKALEIYKQQRLQGA